MFTYLSVLVEEGYFNYIYVNFLIVGHTHCSIDQYFSSLSGKIHRKEFIGSPLSLLELIKLDIGTKKRRVAIIARRIVVYYQISEALTPYINKAIKYISIPHCFKLFRVLGNCIGYYEHYILLMLFFCRSVCFPI